MKKIILTTTFMICSAFASDTLISECEAGNAKACHNVGVEYYESKDFEKALEFFTKGCDGRAAKSCYAISEMYHSGDGVLRSTSKAILHAQKACDESDDPEFCDQMDKYQL